MNFANPTMAQILEAVPLLQWRGCNVCEYIGLYKDNTFPGCECRTCRGNTSNLIEANRQLHGKPTKQDFSRYIGTLVITKEAIPSDRRGYTIPPHTRLRVLDLVGTQHFVLGWTDGSRAASQVHYSKLKTG